MGITLIHIVDVMMCWPIRALATTLNHNFWPFRRRKISYAIKAS